MARKKSVKHREKTPKISKKNSVKLKTPRVRSSFSIVIKNLLLFLFLSLASFVLYNYVLKNYFLINLFFVTAMIFGFMAAGFFITFLVLIVIRIVKIFLMRGTYHVASSKARHPKHKGHKKEIKYTLVQ